MYTTFIVLLIGLHSLAMNVKIFFLERVAISLRPFAVDDSPKSKGGTSLLDVSDLIVDLYHRCKTVNLCKGSSVPHSVLVAATNVSLSSDQK